MSQLSYDQLVAGSLALPIDHRGELVEILNQSIKQPAPPNSF